MSALEDFRALRAQLRTALLSRETMRNGSLPQHRRDLATKAYSNAVDRMVELLDRLSVTPVASGDGARPALEVLEEVLAGIARAEQALRRPV
ncbi:MAG: hypothetical protein BGP11_05500 [Rhodobacterales bacterium 65-51]|uniref:hypothetical protein n=1 Tax=uncultured Gemmobacter sp. TaxID=1095917 RepID=UPI0009611CAC|nr:hypothetical protein [uncultured Gemmobacter sp.]OJY33178.1 MAG: hypothetical protein BGP11_05500 [Rhodobacterales bacterium 65-51]